MTFGNIDGLRFFQRLVNISDFRVLRVKLFADKVISSHAVFFFDGNVFLFFFIVFHEFEVVNEVVFGHLIRQHDVGRDASESNVFFPCRFDVETAVRKVVKSITVLVPKRNFFVLFFRITVLYHKFHTDKVRKIDFTANIRHRIHRRAVVFRQHEINTRYGVFFFLHDILEPRRKPFVSCGNGVRIDARSRRVFKGNVLVGQIDEAVFFFLRFFVVRVNFKDTAFGRESFALDVILLCGIQLDTDVDELALIFVARRKDGCRRDNRNRRN